MPISIKPEALRNGGKVVAGGAGGAGITAIVFYILMEIHSGGSEGKSSQAAVDVKQDMQIQYNQLSITEIKKDQKEIVNAINRMDRKLTRIANKLDH